MPRERFTDQDIAKFFNHKHGTPANDRHRGTNREWALTSSRAYPAKTIRVAYDFGQDIVGLVERHGFRLPHDTVGLAGGDVRLFGAALQRGLEDEESKSPLRDAAIRVLDFVRGPGRDGFKMQSQWA